MNDCPRLLLSFFLLARVLAPSRKSDPTTAELSYGISETRSEIQRLGMRKTYVGMWANVISLLESEKHDRRSAWYTAILRTLCFAPSRSEARSVADSEIRVKAGFFFSGFIVWSEM